MTEFDWEMARARHQEPEDDPQPGDEPPTEPNPEDCQCGRCGDSGLAWGNTVFGATLHHPVFGGGKRHHP